MFRPIILLLTALAAASGMASAQVTANQSVLTERVSVGSDGTRRVEMVPAEKVVPGEKLAYVLTYANEGARPADGLVLVMPVPADVRPSPGSETGGSADYSIDGGDNWGPFTELTVTEDGLTRPARAEDVTHLRWRLTESVAPGEGGEVSYRGTLR